MEQKQICEHCGGKIAYPSEIAGTKSNCPHCSGNITLGSWDNPLLATRPAEVDAKEESLTVEVVRTFILNPKVLIALAVVAFALVVVVVVNKTRQSSGRANSDSSTGLLSIAPNVKRISPSGKSIGRISRAFATAPVEDSVENAQNSEKQFPHQDPLNQGLVAFYPFDGNANDMTEFANHAVVHEVFLTTDRFGKTNSAVGFDGVKSYLEIPDSAAFKSRSFTISLWFFANGYPGNKALTEAQFLVSKGENNFELHLGAPGGSGPSAVRFLPRYGQGAHWDTPNNAYKSGRWYHLAAVYDPPSATTSVFIDSNKVALAGPSARLQKADNNSNVRLGMRTDGTLAFRGKLDDVRIYNRALSAEDIMRLFQSESSDESEKQNTTSKAKPAPPEMDNVLGMREKAPRIAPPANKSEKQSITSKAKPALLEADNVLRFPPPTNNFIEFRQSKGELIAFDMNGLMIKTNGGYAPRIPISKITDEEILVVVNTKKAYQALTTFKGYGARTSDAEAIEMRLQSIWDDGTSLQDKIVTRLTILDAMRNYNDALSRFVQSSASASSTSLNVENLDSQSLNAARVADAAEETRRQAILLGSDSKKLLGVTASRARKNLNNATRAANEAENTADNAAEDASRLAQLANGAQQTFQMLQNWLVNKGFPLSQRVQYIPALALRVPIDAEIIKNQLISTIDGNRGPSPNAKIVDDWYPLLHGKSMNDIRTLLGPPDGMFESDCEWLYVGHIIHPVTEKADTLIIVFNRKRNVEYFKVGLKGERIIP